MKYQEYKLQQRRQAVTRMNKQLSVYEIAPPYMQGDIDTSYTTVVMPVTAPLQQVRQPFFKFWQKIVLLACMFVIVFCLTAMAVIVTAPPPAEPGPPPIQQSAPALPTKRGEHYVCGGYKIMIHTARGTWGVCIHLTLFLFYCLIFHATAA